MSIDDIAAQDLTLSAGLAETVLGGRKAKQSRSQRLAVEPGFVHLPATASSPSMYISVAALTADPDAPAADPDTAGS